MMEIMKREVMSVRLVLSSHFTGFGSGIVVLVSSAFC